MADRWNGYVEVISRNAISGWAEDSGSSVPVSVSIAINGIQVAELQCTASRPEVVEAGFASAKGFYFNPIRVLSQGINQIEVTFTQSGSLIPNGTARVEYDQENDVTDRWNGYVEVISRNAISGWAEDSGSSVPVSVSIMINGIQVAAVPCTASRQEVVEAGFGSAKGFYFNPIGVLSPGVNEIEVRFTQSGSLIPNGTARVEYDPENDVTDRWNGYVEVISRNAISGWAEDSESSVPVSVSIVINGIQVAAVPCTASRQEVVEAGFRSAKSFYFNPIRVLSQGVNEIEVKFKQSGSLIPNGTARVEYDQVKHVADHWSSWYADKGNWITRWWQCDKIVRHINRKVCGDPIPGLTHGLYARLRQRFADRLPFGRAVSVGCGEALKEIDIVRIGLATSFDLYEVSAFAAAQGTKFIKDAGLSDRMTYHLRDAFQVEGLEDTYDAVFWNSSLHHMFDADKAVQWSKSVLRQGGVFVMDEFVGPSYMQWSDRLLEINTRVRSELPEEYLQDPRDPSKRLPVKMERPDLDEFCAIDPSECVDSGHILESVRKHFPDAEIILTGGGVYHLALNDVLHHIVTNKDELMLEKMLLIDDECLAEGETQYGVGIAIRE